MWRYGRARWKLCLKKQEEQKWIDMKYVKDDVPGGQNLRWWMYKEEK
jgi:hypothetical protein